MHSRPAHTQPAISGFTLIELSIVLVIIGLIVGSILVGRDLVAAAGVRAQISQIEKYNTAVNTFRGKYGYLPGDLPENVAAQLGFATGNQRPNERDGDGMIKGNSSIAGEGGPVQSHETLLFWQDMSQAGLLANSFSFCTSDACRVPNGAATNFDYAFPQAKIGNGNYVYVYACGLQYGGGSRRGDGYNYFGLSAPINFVTAETSGTMVSNTGITAQQAYIMDQKIDDGLPQTGKVVAFYTNAGISGAWYAAAIWASGDGTPGPNPGTSAAASPTTCYDNGAGSASTPMAYSTSTSAFNCALSFRFQ